jgi:hypothetical protein
VNTFPIGRIPFDVVVSGLQVDDAAQVQADITTAAIEYFKSRAPYILGLSALPRNDRITSSAVGGVVDDIVSAAGGIFSTVVVTQSASPVNTYQLGQGEKAKADSVTFS